ncbi:MAG: sigma-70 family RNA polymerase sigma factor, partial [Anaerolineaceae bacterium]|nr:sigma-70 family RNA polymerase sigma factor [Anaerolineaceae bacterium]
SAEDLAGEVFLRLLRGIHGQKGSFLAWLYRIAANVVVDHGRKKQTKRETQMSDSVHENLIGEPSPAEAVGRQLDLQQAIAKLTDDQRELVTLKFIQGLGNEDICEITGRKPGALRALQFRALSTLRDILGDEEPRS